MNLARTQARLFRAIAEGKEDGVDRIVDPGLRLSPSRRVEIYAQMYFWRQVDALKEDFPKLAALLGEQGFAQLVEAYLRVYPSEHPSLGKLGRKLAQFISEQAPEGARPDLSDLAALEWARAEVFVERDAPSAPATAFSELPPARFAEAKCHLSPAIRLLSLRWDPMPLWRALENGEAIAEPIARPPLHVLVWRRGWAVYHAAIDADEARALELARRGGALGEICGAFAERDAPAATAFAALQSWIGEGLVARVEPA